MRTKYSNGARYVEADPIVMRHACAYMRLPGAGRGECHDLNNIDAGYCIDAPAMLPGGAMYASAESNVWELTTVREGT